LLYATKRQNTYLVALILGTLLIVALNLWLIPRFGMAGAVATVVLSSVVVDLVAMRSLRSDLRPGIFLAALARLGLPLAATAIVFTILNATALNDWYVAVIACLVFPAFGSLSGLMPNLRRSLLFA
jgi:O-antigen/teichoic acid export membrane protein